MKDPHIYILTTKDTGSFSVGIDHIEDFEAPGVEILDLRATGNDPRLWGFKITSRIIWTTSQNPNPGKP